MDLPRRVLAVSGWQGSGKTTLLASVLPVLRAEGLTIVVVKHDRHGIGLDPAAKDSARLFGVGIDVVVDAPDETLCRYHCGTGGDGLAGRLARLERRYDLVLVEGFKAAPLPRVWLLREGDPEVPAGVTGVLAVLSWGGERAAVFLELVRRQLSEAWSATPRRAGILTGGQSSRLGRAKQELRQHGRSLVERHAELLAAAGAEVALLGRAVAGSDLPVLPDVPGLEGPLAGLLAAVRWDPGACWLLASCDLPALGPEAVGWLLEQRAPGRWVVMPVVGERPQPLLAIYEPPAAALLEELARRRGMGPAGLAGHQRVALPRPPAELAASWEDVDTVEQLERWPGLE
jgi:molybdopterin-guanine dinucleotide biosynthesis protein MobB